jgi:hypothetical protein
MLGFVLVVVACFRLVVVGKMITSWGRRLSRVDSDAGADHRPGVVRAGSYLSQILSSWRERRSLVDSPTKASHDPFASLDGYPAPRKSHQMPDIVDSAD